MLAKVGEAVARAEASTRAELVIAVAPASDRYPEARWALAALAGLLALGVLLVAPWYVVAPLPSLAVVAVAGLAGYGLGVAFPRVRRAVLPPAAVQRAVERAAKVAFVDEGVTATQERTGLLVYASLLERRVRILPDLGLQGAFPDAEWTTIALDTERALRSGQAEDALVETVDRCAELLARHYPPREGDRDELSNAPRTRPVG